MKLILLGTNGFLPTDEAQTACFMLPEQGIVLDAGSGLYRLPDYLQTPSLDIYLSHRHGDHVCGLHYLFGGLFKYLFTRSHAALTEELLETILEQANARLNTVHLHAPQTALTELKNRFPHLHDWHPLQTRETLPNGGALTSFALDPPREETGFRLDWPGHSLAYVTDTIADPKAAYVKEIAGVDLLLHECNGPDRTAQVMATLHHSHTRAVAQVAARAQAKRLILIHKNPIGLTLEEDLPAARTIFPSIEIGQDGMEIEF
ncbi:MAG: ribonuclease Z [Anaerolineae bacterium]|nr:ribonuclease Z [Anaerolineae bacterium]